MLPEGSVTADVLPPVPRVSRGPMNVHQRIELLLRSYDDAMHDWDPGSGGDGVRMMPSMWNEGSYGELERALRTMRDGTPKPRQLWWHVSARYFWWTERQAPVHVRRSRLGPVAIPPPHAEIVLVIEMSYSTALARVREWDERVNDQLVREGVAMLAELMYDGDVGRVVVPRALVRA